MNPLLIVIALSAGVYDAQVTRVVDGDTIEVRIAEEPSLVKIRVMGVDTPETHFAKCPEERQAGEAAAAATREWVARDPKVQLTMTRTDRYGRWLAQVRRGEEDLTQALIGGGYGRPYNGKKREPWCPTP